MLKIPGLVLIAIATTCATAQVRDFDESIECNAKTISNGTTLEKSQCIGRGANEAEFQLTRVYGQIRAELKSDKTREATLIQAQRAWLAWREKEADLCAQSQGIEPTGSLYGGVFGSCKSRLTLQRVEQLRQILRDLKS